jgi:hypothetical protein
MIRAERPPNFAAILAAFPHAGDHGVVFAYGEDIFNPSNVSIPHELMQHEYRHCARQFTYGADKWWTDYIAKPDFRYGEELLAHVDEYLAAIRQTKDRNTRAKILQRTAQRLVMPLYNYEPRPTLSQAMRDLRWHVER